MTSMFTSDGGSSMRLGGGGPRTCTLPKVAHSAQKNFSPSFFSYQVGLSWHLRALHCKFQTYKDRCSWETRRTVPTTAHKSLLNFKTGGAIAPLAPPVLPPLMFTTIPHYNCPWQNVMSHSCTLNYNKLHWLHYISMVKELFDQP